MGFNFKLAQFIKLLKLIWIIVRREEKTQLPTQSRKSIMYPVCCNRNRLFTLA